jgi:hypothetical protein
MSQTKNGGLNSWFGISHGRINDRGDPTALKNSGGSWFAEAHNTGSGHSQNPVTGEGVKVPGMNWSDRTRPAQGFNMEAIKREGVKQHGSGAECFDKALDERREATAIKNGADTFGWSKDSPLRNNNSKSDSRRAASAMIARIPYALSLFIARCFWPTDCSALPQESAHCMEADALRG